MGFFSKLLGENSELGELLNDVANVIKQESVNLHESEIAGAETTYTDHDDSAYLNKLEKENYGSADYGFSWGPVMPDEPNQYNFNGTYKEYFRDVFSSTYSSYRIEESEAYNGRGTIFTFWEGDKKALVVELLSRKSSVCKLREDCQKAHIPYLRFYYDYDGWWNTREYVIQRTRVALMG